MEIIRVVPQGYCQGVIRAIQIAQQTAEKYPNVPITILGMIVHNKYVVQAFEKIGVRTIESKNLTRLELLDEINEGIVIFTAHGVSDEVIQKAHDKGLIAIDATCKDVAKTHTIIKNHVVNGDVIYIGKRNHPESEGATQLSSRVHLITCEKEIDDLPPLSNILITTQTTLSTIETKHIIEKLIKKYPDATVEEEICNATTIRQSAISNLKNIDVLLIVGDPHSNNSNQLVEIGKQSGIPSSFLIESIDDLKEDMIKGAERIAVSSGSSTPSELTNQIIDFLKEYSETSDFSCKPKTSIHRIL